MTEPAAALNLDPAVAPRLLPGHERCFACSPLAVGLRLDCRPAPDDAVAGTLVPESWMTGYNGMMHGGLVATLLDSAMTQWLLLRGISAVTATLHVRYREPVPLTSPLPLTVTAWCERSSHGVHRMAARLEGDARVLADAEAQFMLPAPSRTP